MKRVCLSLFVCTICYTAQAMEQKKFPSILPDDIIITNICPYLFDPYTHIFTKTTFKLFDQKDADSIKTRYKHLIKHRYRLPNIKDLLTFGRLSKKTYELKKKYIEQFAFASINDLATLESKLLHSKYLTRTVPKVSFEFPLLQKISSAIMLKQDQDIVRATVRRALLNIINAESYCPPGTCFSLCQEGILWSMLLILQFMQKHSYDINETFEHIPELPLVAACWAQNVAVVKLLLHAGVKPELKERYVNGALKQTVARQFVFDKKFMYVGRKNEYTAYELVEGKIKNDKIACPNSPTEPKLLLLKDILMNHNKEEKK